MTSGGPKCGACGAPLVEVAGAPAPSPFPLCAYDHRWISRAAAEIVRRDSCRQYRRAPDECISESEIIEALAKSYIDRG